jgi:hypothetical protein
MAFEPSGIPDMRYINRQVPILEVARALDLKLDGERKIHCWHTERHKNGDRTASVGIRSTNNTAKCFACDSKPMGPIDLVMDVLTMPPADAAIWIASRFDVPSIPARKRVNNSGLARHQTGYGRPFELLVRSGLWAQLPEAARCIAVPMLELSEKQRPTDDEFVVQISYFGLARYSGVHSPNSIRKALLALSEIGFIKLPDGPSRCGPDRVSARYIVTPFSNQLWELAQAFARQTRNEIEAQTELRARQKRDRLRLMRIK